MIGIDTNVLIRWLVTDPSAPEQSDRATEMLESARESIMICPVVLAELTWVLESRFGFRRNQIAMVLQTLIDAPSMHFEQRQAVERSVQVFADGRADYSDCLIAALNFAAGCKTTLTFDKTAAKGDHFTLLH